MSVLAYVTVEYKTLAAVVDTSADEDFDPNIRPVTANVDFTYRVPPGWAFRIPDYEPYGVGLGTQPTDVAIESFTTRLDEGNLVTLAGDPVRLVANTPSLTWPHGDLYVDVTFRNVVFNRKLQTWAPFAIKMPTAGGGTINLTTVERAPFVPRTQYTEWFQRNHPST